MLPAARPLRRPAEGNNVRYRAQSKDLHPTCNRPVLFTACQQPCCKQRLWSAASSNCRLAQFSSSLPSCKAVAPRACLVMAHMDVQEGWTHAEEQDESAAAAQLAGARAHGQHSAEEAESCFREAVQLIKGCVGPLRQCNAMSAGHSRMNMLFMHDRCDCHAGPNWVQPRAFCRGPGSFAPQISSRPYSASTDFLLLC